MNKFLETCNLLTLNLEKIKCLNRTIPNKKIEAVLKTIPTKKGSGSDGEKSLKYSKKN